MVNLTGRTYDYYEFKDDAICVQELREGDILIQFTLDQNGKMAAKGKHTNLGYSGYYKGFLYALGGARVFKGWRELWPYGENRYAAQKDKEETFAAVSKAVTQLAGHRMVKVRGGWQLEDNGNVDHARIPVD